MLDAKRIADLVMPLYQWMYEHDWPTCGHSGDRLRYDEEKQYWSFMPKASEAVWYEGAHCVEALFTVAIQRALRRRGYWLVIDDRITKCQVKIDSMEATEARTFVEPSDLEAMCEAAKWAKEKEASSA